MKFRNCSVLEKLLVMLMLLLEFSLADNRVKRLSEPEFDESITLGLAKYVVSIRSRTPRKYFGDNHFCSGAIVASKYVLTSATCVVNPTKVKIKSRTIVVVGGTPNQMRFVDSKSVILVVAKIHAPLDYTSKNTKNIALLKLKESWPTDNPRIAIINLPRSEPKFNSDYTVVSWGRMYKRGPFTAIVNHINVTLLEIEQCKSILKSFKAGMLCTGDPQKKIDRDPCGGDIGAPLLINQTVYGVVSYNLGCGNTKLPSVYTNVWQNLDWITATIHSGQGGNSYYKLAIVQVALISVSLLLS